MPGKSGRFLILSGSVLYAHSTIFSKLALLGASVMGYAVDLIVSLNVPMAGVTSPFHSSSREKAKEKRTLV